MANQPRILNLDELPTVKSALTIVHKGVEHPMQILTVEAFIDQQRRSEEHAATIAQAEAEGVEGDKAKAEFTQLRAIEIMKEAVESFFPTLPVGELPTVKLLTIFAWLNETSQTINEAGAPEGNGEGEAA